MRATVMSGGMVEAVRIGVVRVEHAYTESDNVSCEACSWGIAVGPPDLAMSVATRHNTRHSGEAAPPAAS